MKLTTTAAARALNCSPETVRNLVRARVLPAERDERGNLILAARDIEALRPIFRRVKGAEERQ
jgi:excisionase family DNA binding protein